MWIDPIVEETRQFGDDYAGQFNYDLAAMFHDLQEKQRQEGRIVVSFQPKPYLYSPPPETLRRAGEIEMIDIRG
jgi:hypothetical protein